MTQEKPTISAVVVVGKQRERAGRALRSILSQDGFDQAEVVMVDTQPKYTPVPGSDHPSVHVIYPEKGCTFGEARAAGVHHARGKYVAFLEEHSLAFPGWLKGTMDALSGSWVGVGPEMHNANAGQGISDAVWLMNYPATWRPPAAHRTTRGIPGHNSSYRRDVLVSMNHELAPMLHSEVMLHWKFEEMGLEIGIDPAIKASHLSETTLRHVVFGYYFLHRHFGAARATVWGWSFFTRILRVLATPLVPLVRFVRFAYFALRYRPEDLRILFRFAHTIWIVQSSAALGMAVGYLFGAGTSGHRFLEFEADASRGEGPGE